MADSSASNRTDEQEKATAQDDEELEFIRQVGWKALFSFTTKKHVPVLSVACVAATCAALTLPGMAIVYGLIFRQFADFGAGTITGTILLRNASQYCVYLASLTAGNWLANCIYFGFFLSFGELQARSARNRIFNALVRKDMTWYDTRQSGIAALLPAVQMQIRDLQLAVSAPFGEGFQCLLQAAGALGVAFYHSWNLTLVIICTVPLVYIVMAFLSNRFTKRAHEQADKLQQALKCATNVIHCIETVKYFNGERLELQRYINAVTHAAGLYKRQANLRSMQIGFMQFIALSIFVQGFWYGSHLVMSGERNAAQVVTTFWGALMAVQAITGFLPQFVILQKGKVAGARLRVLLSQISENGFASEEKGTIRPSRCLGDVEFKKVSFAYPTRPDQVAISDMSLFFAAGETTFVIGKSGSGKSTLGQLLVRFYGPASGEIDLDGIPLDTLDVQWLRDNVTLVEQHSVLFNDTIRNNIALGRKGESVGDSEVNNAARFAMLEQMVLDLPEGLDTLLGMKGDSISGGQRQRMALARARVRNTPVLILDETTSALDYITRYQVLEAIRRWRKGKTTIIITHDISQILPDDFAYVLCNGRVVEEGYRKAIESHPHSIFQSFLASEKEQDAEGEESDCDDTNGIFSLYEDSWSPPVQPVSTRPVSSINPFGNSLISPFFTPGVRSSLLTPDMNGLGRDSLVPTDIRRDVDILDTGSGKAPPGAMTFRQLMATTDGRRYSQVSYGSRPASAASYRSISRARYPRSLSVLSTRDEPLDIPVTSDKERKWQEPKASRKRSVNSEEEIVSGIPSMTIMQIMSTVWPGISWRSRLTLFAAFCCAVVHAGATPSFAFIFARLLSTFYSPGDQKKEAQKYALIILGISTTDGLASYGLHFLFDVVAQDWASTLKSEAMKRILMQPREFFDREINSVSRLAECLDHCAEEARNLPGRFTGIPVVMVVMVIITISWSLASCWKLTLVCLGCGPVLYAITRTFQAISSRWETIISEANEDISQVLHETFVNIRTVRCLSLEDVFRARYKATTAYSLKVGLKRAIYSGSIYGLNYSAILFVATLLFWYGSYIISRREFDVTQVIETFTILLVSVSHINQIGNYIPQINIARDAASRLIRLARLPQDSHELSGTVQIHSVGDIRLQNLNFTYPTRKDHTVLHNVSFSIPRGSCIAIVGSSGSGKSTIASLIVKLYQPDAPLPSPSSKPNDLSISNQNVRTLHTATLRSRIAVVAQSPVLFPGTIAENITYGLSPSSLQASPSAIRAATSAAGVADFIDSLPQGYQTLIGEGGSGLSGGQAQRISIARALVRDPDILILDEATSALDVESAGIVRDTIQSLVAGRGKGSSRVRSDGERAREMTVVIITHAREMMAIAEHIVMLDKGKVVEEGGFEDLKMRKGAFAKLLKGESAE